MIRKEIKLKETAAMVAKELVNDLTQELDCFGTYEVKLENIGIYYVVVVTSPKCICNILTRPCVDRIITVVKMYELRYINISYHIDVVEEEEKHLPAIIIQATYSNK